MGVMRVVKMRQESKLLVWMNRESKRDAFLGDRISSDVNRHDDTNEKNCDEALEFS